MGGESAGVASARLCSNASDHWVRPAIDDAYSLRTVARGRLAGRYASGIQRSRPTTWRRLVGIVRRVQLRFDGASVEARALPVWVIGVCSSIRVAYL